MTGKTGSWDYLIVTAANDQQAKAYEHQLQERQKAGELPQVRHCLVIPDLEGRRIGSGGSTLHSLACVLHREKAGDGAGSFEEAEAILSGLRILIVHAGGDSRRLPAYCHCGKMFVPIPAQGQHTIAATLFDRIVPIFLSLPESRLGQIVVASGDALILFDPTALKLDRPGITALGCFVSSEEAAHHGVFCADKNGSVRSYWQKPSMDTQVETGAVNEKGESVLDLGVMSMDASAAVLLMRAFFAEGLADHGKPALEWQKEARGALYTNGINLYREICCALGTETSFEQYVGAVRASGSTLDYAVLARWFGLLRRIPLNLEILPRCKFLHFGTTRELITNGIALLAEELGRTAHTALILNSAIDSELTADQAWIEGCVVRGKLTLEGWNAVVGVDVLEPLRLQKGACFDLSAGVSRKGERVWFFRYYGIDDTFKHSAEAGGTFCGQPLQNWLEAMGADDSTIWTPEAPERERTLWNARMFPALREHQEYRLWLWLLDVKSATPEQKREFLAADRYSCAEVAVGVDQTKFYLRRKRMQARETQQSDQGVTKTELL
jgi:fucokinase